MQGQETWNIAVVCAAAKHNAEATNHIECMPAPVRRKGRGSVEDRSERSSGRTRKGERRGGGGAIVRVGTQGRGRTDAGRELSMGRTTGWFGAGGAGGGARKHMSGRVQDRHLAAKRSVQNTSESTIATSLQACKSQYAAAGKTARSRCLPWARPRLFLPRRDRSPLAATLLLNTHDTPISTPVSLLLEQALFKRPRPLPVPRALAACKRAQFSSCDGLRVAHRECASAWTRRAAPRPARQPAARRSAARGPCGRGLTQTILQGCAGQAAEARTGLRPSDGRPCATQRAQATSLPPACPLSAPAADGRSAANVLRVLWKAVGPGLRDE